MWLQKSTTHTIVSSLFKITFEHLLVTYLYQNYQGGLSEGYKKHLVEKELADDTYKEDGVALFRVQGTGPDNMQSIQVEPVSSSSTCIHT